MSLTETIENNNLYLSIIGGSLMQKVQPDTQKAIKREYETSDGKKGVKWEIRHKNLTGKIVGLQFLASDFGEQLRVRIENNGESAVVSIALDSRYFTDFGKKISNIDLTQNIVFNSYDFTNKEGKRLQGLSITQNGEKVTNYFWDAEKKEVLHDFPQPEGDKNTFDSDDWKMFFIRVKKFLKTHIEKIEMPDVEKIETQNDGNFEVIDEPDDLPF